MKQPLLIALLVLFLSACGAQADGKIQGASDQGITERHQAQVPAEYAGLTNPIPADETSLERGAKLYATNCASCHGDGGMGDGPVGAALDPAPAPVAQTSQMMADDYLFWRVSEGGAPFNTSMPPWKFMEKQDRWDIINYMRALGDGTAQPSSGAGGVSFDRTAQAAHQAVEDLLEIRPIQEILKLAADGDGALLQATITFAHRLGSFKMLGDKTRGWVWLKP